MRGLVFLFTVSLIFALIQNGYTAAIRNSQDLDEIVDLDHNFFTYGNLHDNDDVLHTVKYYFRSDTSADYRPLTHNPSIDLNSPLCYVENTSIKCEISNVKGFHFYKDANGSIAMSVQNVNGTMQVQGLISDDKGIREIQPLSAEGSLSNRHHVIRKRSATTTLQRPKASRLAEYSPFPSRLASPYKETPSVTSSSDYCVDILCVVDYSIYKKFKEEEITESKALEKIRYYYAHVINGINQRYATIADKEMQINVRLAGYFIAKSPSDLSFIDSKKVESDPSYRVDSNYTLTELDLFLQRLKAKKTVLPDYNHAMLFLEYASASLGGTVLGTSFVSGICSESRGTSLVVDHGAYTSAGIGTHELGHNLGVYFHDGEGTARTVTCNASLNYVMAPASYLIDAGNLQYSFMFSKCSLDQIRDNLDRLIKLGRNCLQCSNRKRTSADDVQTDAEVQRHMQTLPGAMDDVHKQCHQLYGEGSFMCPPATVEEMCYRMYCYDPKRSACAIISEQMAATGTPCGRYKVCKMGKCVPDSKGIDVPDDCPYPDLPSHGAHCEDATPYMCTNEKFKQKCCTSCNKKFTAEEACKDSHILINGMTCEQLMTSVFGRPGCASDVNVQQICCKSCNGLLKTGPGEASSMHVLLGLGSHSAQEMYSSQRDQREQYMLNRFSNSGSKTPAQLPVPKSVRVPDPSDQDPPPDCVDSKTITFNNMACPVLVLSDKRYCTNTQSTREPCAEKPGLKASATTRRPWRPYSDPTTSLLRLLRLYGVTQTSLTERRKTQDFGDYFEHVESGRRGLAS
ncbi:hypothetical protein DPMN_185336 [Dreissena polymorpha]|uniref:Peptidase M12B domain-containing protein n=1 Tax=Dreissena polymorpha TaxID=45954 RepID=A0A9D4DML9_DREPO|nr:hypothetical protein DPMN_185336 [Dreissena polymorpha]